MVQYQVPQFIEVEAKIIGPFTLKQFLWLAGAGAIIFMLYFLISIKWIWILVTIFIAGISISLALVKINGRTFFSFLDIFLSYVFKPRFFLWRKEQIKGSAQTGTAQATQQVAQSSLQKIQLGPMKKSGLKELSNKLLFKEE